MDFVTGGTIVTLGRDVIKGGHKRWLRRVPIKATVETVVPDLWNVTTDSMEIIENFPDSPGYGRIVHDLLLERGAADFRVTQFRLRIHNTSRDSVSIRNIRVVKSAEREPNSALRIYHPTAGHAEITCLQFNLDEESPAGWSVIFEPTYYEWRKSGSAPFFSDNYTLLQPDEPIEFNVIATADQIYCEWSLEVDYVISSSSGSLVVGDPDVLFRTSGAPENGFENHLMWAWFEQPAGFRLTNADNETLWDH